MVMHLKDIEEYSIAEICEALEMESNAVRINLDEGPTKKIKHNSKKFSNMKTDRSKQYKDQYFCRKFFRGRRKWLKDFSDDVFFKTLREEKRSDNGLEL